MDPLGIEVTALAFAYVCLSVLLQRKLTNPRRTYEIQDIIKKKTQELQEMAKKNADQKAMAAKQGEITGLLSESMRSSMKPMFVVLPIFLVLYYLIFPQIFPATLTVTVLSMTLGYKTYFVAVAFILGIVLSMSLMAIDKAKMKKAAQLVQQEGAG